MKKALAAVLLLALAGACAQNVDDQPPQASPPEGHATSRPEAAPGGHLVAPAAEGGGLGLAAPSGWVAEATTSSFRRAQYRLPGEAGDATVVVFYFGPGQGGGIQANLERWKSQFTDSKAEPRIAQMTIGEVPVTVMDVSGTYNSGMMMGGAGPREGYRMRAAIFPTPGGNWFVRLLGPEATVEEWGESFDAYLNTARPGAD